MCYYWPVPVAGQPKGSRAKQEQEEQMESVRYVGDYARLVNGHRESLEGVDVLWWVTGDSALFERTLGRTLLQFAHTDAGGHDLSLDECIHEALADGNALPRERGHAALGFRAFFRLYRRYARHPRRDRALSPAEWDLLNWLEGLGYLDLGRPWPAEKRGFVLMALNATSVAHKSDEDLLAIVRDSRALVEQALRTL